MVEGKSHVKLAAFEFEVLVHSSTLLLCYLHETSTRHDSYGRKAWKECVEDFKNLLCIYKSKMQ